MSEKTKQVLLITISIAGMAVFCFIAFFQPAENGNQYMNMMEKDNGPSKREIYDNKQKKERLFSFDRKVSSLDDFLGSGISKDPFDRAITAPIDSMKDTDPPPKVRTVIKVIEVPVDQPEKLYEEVRRTGFASGAVVVAKDIDKQMPVVVPVVVHEGRKVMSGESITLRTTTDVELSGMLVSKNTFVYGEAEVSGDFLFVHVEEIGINGFPLRINLEAYDVNGYRGILLSAASELKGDVADRTIGEVQREVRIPILGDLPFRTARKNIRDRAVPVPEGLKLYLREP